MEYVSEKLSDFFSQVYLRTDLKLSLPKIVCVVITKNLIVL